LGVFDGHGKMGEEVAEFAVTELPRRLAIELQAITKLDRELDVKVSHALVKVFKEIDQSIPTKGIGGCTASIVLRLGSKIYVANAGDSVSFVASHTEATEQVNVLYVTREDKPHLPEEYHRILEMGGKVSQPKHKDDSSRVLFIDRTTNTVAGLAMSRSIGDWDATGVISEPLVQVLEYQNCYSNE
jgi:serine/threonine protein phosphatase PrpC